MASLYNGSIRIIKTNNTSANYVYNIGGTGYPHIEDETKSFGQ
jgi:hypothetical protein